MPYNLFTYFISYFSKKQKAVSVCVISTWIHGVEIINIYMCACNCAQRKRLGITLNSKLLTLLGQSRLATQYNYWWLVGFLFWQEISESQISITQLIAQVISRNIFNTSKKKKNKKKPTMKSRLSSMFFKTYTTITFFY